MKIFLLFPPQSHSLRQIFSSSLKKLGYDVIVFKRDNYVSRYNSNLLNRVIHRISPKYALQKEIDEALKWNKYVYENIKLKKPDIIISYNDNGLLSDTVEEIKKQAKFILFLADNPFYSFNKKGFLKLAIKADHCIVPDTAAMKQLKMVGVKNITYSNIGYDPDVFKPYDLSDDVVKEYGSDIFYLGNIHWLDSWAYKRALMLSYLADLDLRVFGNKTWKRVLSEFPELKKKFTLLKEPMGNDELRIRMAASKIYPVDHHPGIINGIHIRVFDAIAGGILPIVEYRKDLVATFDDVTIPYFKTFEELREKTKYYLENDNDRIQKLKELNIFISKHFQAKNIIRQLLKEII